MKTTSKKKTKVAKRIEQNETGQEYIKEITKLSAYGYFWKKVDLGIEFLEKHFPRSGDYEKHYLKASGCSNFWAWWNLKYTDKESRFIGNYKERSKKQNYSTAMSNKLYNNCMNSLIDDEELNHSFYTNYLKLKDHV